MKHCFECLKWIGCPPALIAIILVIHESPKACVRGTEAWFEVLRGIHQGCFLCLTLFGLLLDFLLHLADHGLLGVELTCENKRELSCPQDILGQDFKEEKFGYIEDLAVVSTCLDNLSSAQHQRQKDTVVVALPTTNLLQPALFWCQWCTSVL